MAAWGRPGYGTRRFDTAIDSVAAPRSNAAPEMFRAAMRTVLFDHANASSLMKRVDEASEASARSPYRAPGTVTSTRCTAPGASDGRSSGTSTTNSRWPTGRVGAPQWSAGAAPLAARRGGVPRVRSARPGRRRRSARRRRRRRGAPASGGSARRRPWWRRRSTTSTAFQTMVVSEASTSLATFSRTVPSPPKQRTKEPAAVGAVDHPMSEGELLGLGAIQHEGHAG